MSVPNVDPGAMSGDLSEVLRPPCPGGLAVNVQPGAVSGFGDLILRPACAELLIPPGWMGSLRV